MKKQRYIVEIEMPDGDFIHAGWLKDLIQAVCDVEDESRQKVTVQETTLTSNLDEAAETFNREDAARMWDYEGKTEGEIVKAAFKAGTEWMAGQGVKIGETKIYLEDDGDEPPYSQEWLDLESTEFKIPDGVFEVGDEVEIILRKKQ